MEKIKICFGVTKANWGGAQKYVYDLATHLPPARFAVSVVAGGRGEFNDRLVKQKITVLTLNTLGRDISLWRDLVSFWRLFRILSKNRPDILHLNSPKMGLLGALAGRLARVKKIIYTSHGWPFLENRSALSRWFLKTLCWKIALLAHRTIVISESEKKETENWPFVRHKIRLIYNGLKPIDFLPQTEARKKLNLAERDLVVGTIAELHKNKGLEYLPKIDGVNFVVIGEGEERKSLEKNKNLILLGNIPNASSFLLAFDIFVLPSIKEGLPYVILEAGLAALPVIATRVGGIPEIIENNVSGVLVEPKDVRSLTSNIQLLISSPQLRKTYGENLRAKVQNNFNLEKMMSETRKIYEK